MKLKGSPAHVKFLKRERRSNIVVRITQIGLLVLFLATWQLFATYGIVDAFITSSPTKIFATFKTVYGEIWKHIGVTMYETVVSFILATVGGTIIAVLLWLCALARRITEPYLVVLNALPKIALGPIIIIWFGAGTGAIVVMALLISLIITIINTLHGFISVDPDKLLLMQTMRANKMQVLFKLVLPANIPNMISCLKINVGLTFVGTIMGEYLVSKAGLGYLIVYGGQVFNLSLVMLSTLILCLLSGGMYAVVALIEKIAKKFYNF